jgi:hypothetical protein
VFQWFNYFLFAGLPSQRSASRHLLPGLAMAGLAISPRVEGRALLQLPLQLKTERRLHQSVPLCQGRIFGLAARSCSQIFGPDSWTKRNDALPAHAG